MVLLLPCISVERASNIVPFNAGSLMFHYSFAVFRGESREDIFIMVVIFVVSGEFFGKKGVAIVRVRHVCDTVVPQSLK